MPEAARPYKWQPSLPVRRQPRIYSWLPLIESRPPARYWVSGSDFKQSLPQPFAHSVGAGDGTKLAKQRLDVEFDSVLGDAEPARRGLVAKPIGDCGQHLSFAGRQQRGFALVQRFERRRGETRHTHDQPGGGGK